MVSDPVKSTRRGPIARRRSSDRPQQILAVARQLLLDQGLAGVTYEAIGQQLGVTKQAVIYWFRTKEDLLRALALDAVAAESQALQDAIATEPADLQVPRAVLHAMLRHHSQRGFADLRLMYMSSQLLPEARTILRPEDLQQAVYPVTGAFYAALAARLEPRVGQRARVVASSIHLAGLGLCTMAGLMEATGDTMKASFEAQADALGDLFAAGLEG